MTFEKGTTLSWTEKLTNKAADKFGFINCAKQPFFFFYFTMTHWTGTVDI